MCGMNIKDFFWPGPRLPMSGALLLVALACALVVTLPAGGGTLAIPPSLSIADASVGEGNAATTKLVFRVSLSRPSRKAVKVAYTTLDGTAIAPGDYKPAGGTLTIKAGKTSASITVLANGDTTPEPNEQLTVLLSAPQGATIAAGTAVGTIVDDDAPSVSIADASVTEGDLGLTVATFTLTLSAPSTLPISVGYQTADGTASSLSDYTAASGTADFDPGETTADVTVLVQGDVLSEADETFAVDLSAPVNVRIGDGHGAGTIDDDDPLPSLSVGDATIVEGTGGTTPMTYTVTLAPASGQTVTVGYSTADGTATSPGDYQPSSGTLTFAPGQTSKTVTVLVQADAAFEPSETLILGLSSPTGATIGGSGTGTIDDDDDAISIADAAVTEGNSGTANAVFAVRLGAASPNTITVDYSTFDGSATAPDDYGTTSGTLTFAPGQTAKQILVPVNGDQTVEANEIFTVNLTNPSNASVAGTGIGTGTITNDDAPPSLSIANATVTEGNSGTVNAVFAVSLSGPSAATITVDFATADGTATAPDDYTATTGTLTFVPGQTAKQISVPVKGDTVIEGNETFAVNLTSPTAATISGSGFATGTITDDDQPAISIGNATANEGNAGTTAFTFAVTLSAPSANTVTVDYSTFDGSAVAPGDYGATSGTLSFAAGQTAKQVVVSVNGDTTVEATETFALNLANPSNATISGTGIGTATITNDDALPTVTIGNVTANEGNSGTTNFAFAVTLSAASANTVTVDYSTANGAAVAPGDYASGSGTVTFNPGQTAKQIVISVNGDTTVETTETFTVNLTNPSNATIAGTGIGTGTITNDDALPTVTIGNATANEGNSGTTTFTFAVTLSAPSASTVTVDYATADGSAVAPGDYASGSGTVTFNPGQTAKQIVVSVNGDTTVETTETYTVGLSNATNATIAGTGIGTGTITNDDALPTVTIGNVTANEGNSGTTNFAFAVTLSAASASSVTVDYSTADGSAVASGDYAAASGTVTFNPGQTAKQIVVSVNGDTTVETTETCTVNLTNPSNATIAGTGIGTGTITNDDALPTLSIANATVTEGNSGTVNAVFAVTLSAASSSTVTVDYSTFDGAAVAPGDFVAASGTLTFTAGQTTKQIVVAVKGDTLNEINETYTVNLANPTNATISGTGIATGTITNDDAVPTLSINNVTLAEGNSGTTSFTFTVTLSAASGLPVTVDFATVDGSAIAPGDYQSQTGTLTFNPGQTTRTITVLVNGDTTTEGSENFTVVLSNPVNATTSGTGIGTGTITNDD
jgi:large repetitive protein